MTDISKTISTTISTTISNVVSTSSNAPKPVNLLTEAIDRGEITYDGMVAYVASIAHEVNRAYCTAIGDLSQLPWDMAEEWQKSSAILGVKFHVATPNAGPSASHESWLAAKAAEGWAYGIVKDVEAKLHPCFVPFDELPTEQKVKDYLFTAIVNVHRDTLNALNIS